LSKACETGLVGVWLERAKWPGIGWSSTNSIDSAMIRTVAKKLIEPGRKGSLNDRMLRNGNLHKYVEQAYMAI